MSREPILPKHTCPLIDQIQKAIDKAYDIANRVEGSDEVDELNRAVSYIQQELYRLSEDLEPIRDANLALRNAAEYWQNEAENLRDEVSVLVNN